MTQTTSSVSSEHGFRNRLLALISLAVAVIGVALLRFDVLPLMHVTGESLIYALIFTTLALVGFVFYILCRWLVSLLRRRFRLPIVIVLFLFVLFAILYLSLNVIAQTYDPTIDRVLRNLALRVGGSSSSGGATVTNRLLFHWIDESAPTRSLGLARAMR